MWGYNGHYYRRAAKFGNYDDEKRKMNNEIKRAIIRKLKDFFIENEFKSDDFRLKDNDEKTIALIDKYFKE